MSDRTTDAVEFEDAVAVALAQAADVGERPGPDVKARLLARLAEAVEPLPEGYALRRAAADDWMPHPVPGIRMKVLAINRECDYATLLLDVMPGTRFPAHHHDGDEECYIISGSAHTFGRRMGPGDFLHADAGTDHGELYTETGCQVLLVVRPEDYLPGFTRPPAS